jgi:hypothetical protein
MSLENSLEISPEEIQRINAFPATVKSWFCRYYDHLFQLVIMNVLWALLCLGPTFVLFRFGFLLKSGLWNIVGVAGIGFWDVNVSILTARAVFLVLNEGDFSGEVFRKGLWLAWLKALGIFLIWAGVIGWSGYNLYFYTHWNPLVGPEKWLLSGLILWFFFFWLCCFFYLWPILFFQNPPFFRIFYKSILLVFENQFFLFLCLILFLALFFLFSLIPVGWLLLGFVFFFSIQCMLLEKHFLRYKIIYKNKDYSSFLTFLMEENKRDWKYFLRPWENK